MKAILLSMLVGSLLAGCSQQQGGLGGAGEGSDSAKGFKTGSGKEKNSEVDPATGNVKGTVTPGGKPTTNVINGAR